MSYKATIKNVFDFLEYIKHIFDKKPKILDNVAINLVILFVLEQMFEERLEDVSSNHRVPNASSPFSQPSSKKASTGSSTSDETFCANCSKGRWLGSSYDHRLRFVLRATFGHSGC